MSLVALGSLKATGVSTATLALAAVWPAGRDVVAVEMDPAGGDLAARFGLASEPGTMTLAAAARRESDPGLLLRHSQQLPAGLRVVTAPPSADRASNAVRLLADTADAWSRGDVLALADLGRLSPGTDDPSARIVAAADLLVLVCPPSLAALHRLADGAGALADQAPGVVVLLSGAGPYLPAEVAHAVGLPVVGTLPQDRLAADLLAGAPGAVRALRRTPLLRAAAAVATALQARLTPPAAPGALCDVATQSAGVGGLPASAGTDGPRAEMAR